MCSQRIMAPRQVHILCLLPSKGGFIDARELIAAALRVNVPVQGGCRSQ